MTICNDSCLEGNQVLFIDEYKHCAFFNKKSYFIQGSFLLKLRRLQCATVIFKCVYFSVIVLLLLVNIPHDTCGST